MRQFDFDLVITLSPEAHHKALEFTRDRPVTVEYWPTMDATGIDGAREQKLEAYRAVRDGLMARIKQNSAGALSGTIEMATALWLGPFSGGEAGRRNALSAFFATQLKVGRERLSLTHDEWGAPLLLLDGGPGAWRVSLSSRENIALFAISREKIGVDVEVLAAMATRLECAARI